MAYNGHSQGGAGRTKVSGAGWMVMIVILVVGGMMLFGKKGDPPEPEPNDPYSDQTVQGQRPQTPAIPRAQEPVQKRTVGKGDWALEEVEVGSAGRPTVPPTTRPKPNQAKITSKGDWSITEIDTGDESGAKVELRAAPKKADAKVTKKGDWSIEEFENDTKPAGELKLADPKDPKTTKKGDWELEVD